MAQFILFETASGYGLFKKKEAEDIASQIGKAQTSINDFKRFSKMVELIAFLPFESPESALENINSVSEGIVTDDLKNFLSTHFSKSKKKKKVVLGVGEDKLGSSLSEELGIKCMRDVVVKELLRGMRLHFSKFIKGLQAEDLSKAQLGLAHAYSRSKVKFNVNRVDNMIIQSIALLDQLDKDINTFAMRVREWYGWHFPELIKIVPDNIAYSKLAWFIKKKEALNESHLEKLEAITMDSQKAKEILAAARTSMGQDISDFDILNICRFAERVVSLANYRAELYQYLSKKMGDCAPNLTALIGEVVGARLISHAGSLTSLAKYPASTVQILGAEKALFRALKTRSNTPKYGLIYHSTFIGRAQTKNKGRISRYLANKCSIASRIDCFSDEPSSTFGKKLREQVEERLQFYESGTAPRKNQTVMESALKELNKEQNSEEKKIKKEKKTRTPKKKQKKSHQMSDDDSSSDSESILPPAPKKEKKKSSSKKNKKDKKKTSSSSSSSSKKKSSSKRKRKRN